MCELFSMWQHTFLLKNIKILENFLNSQYFLIIKTFVTYSLLFQVLILIWILVLLLHTSSSICSVALTMHNKSWSLVNPSVSFSVHTGTSAWQQPQSTLSINLLYIWIYTKGSKYGFALHLDLYKGLEQWSFSLNACLVWSAGKRRGRSWRIQVWISYKSFLPQNMTTFIYWCTGQIEHSQKVPICCLKTWIFKQWSFNPILIQNLVLDKHLLFS